MDVMGSATAIARNLAAPAAPPRRYWLLALTAVLFNALGWGAMIAIGTVPNTILSYLLNILVYALYTAVIISLERLIYLRRQKRSGSAGDGSFSARWIEKLHTNGPILIAIFLFLPMFSMLKSAIPLFTDYSWDPILIEWDRTIHGKDTWLIIQPLAGFPIVTAILAFLYHLWVLLPYFGCLSILYYVRDRALVFRFFMAYFMCWMVLGVGAAIAFASVGPCFAAQILDNHTFDAQMAYLREANQHFPIMVLDVQDTLIEWHRSGAHGLGRGISAMPSMHVSVALLFALACRRISRPLFIAASVFALLIMIASVHLAYHYAVDGYVSIIGTLIIWAVAGWIERATRNWGASAAISTAG